MEIFRDGEIEMRVNKRTKIIASVIISLVILLSLIVKKSLLVSAFQQQAEPGSLEWLAQDAQANGLQEVTIPTLFWDKEAVGGFDDATAKYTVVVAQPVKAQSYAWIPEAQTIGTWYKFQILETLSSKPLLQCAECPPTQDAPSEMQPLNAGEMAVSKFGGTLVINGIPIHSVDGDFPDFVVSQRYLLFIDLDTSKRVGDVSSGGVAVFSVDGSGNLAPLIPNSEQLTTDIANRFGNSLNQIRAYFNPPPPPPPPSSCDSTGSQQRWCDSHYGDWDPSSCTCTNACATPSQPWKCQ